MTIFAEYLFRLKIKTNRNFAFAIIAICLMMPIYLSAQTLTWSGGADGTGAIWSTTDANWLNGASTVAWTDNSAAVFNTEIATLTFSGIVNCKSITVNENVTSKASTTTIPSYVGGDASETSTINVASGKCFKFTTTPIAETTTLVKEGDGELVCSSAASSVASSVIMNAGTLQCIALRSLGKTFTMNGGVLTTNASNKLTTYTNTFNIGGNITIGSSGAANGSNSNCGITFSPINGINLTDANRTITLGGSGTQTFSGKLTSTTPSLGALTIAGTGKLVLSNPANDYTGGTTINGGTLILGAEGVLTDAGAVTLGGGTLKTGSSAGFSETIGTLTLTDNSTIALGTGVHTLTIASSSAKVWTSGKTLTITGWAGTPGALGSASEGKIMVAVGGLTTAQLAQVSFEGFTGVIITQNGELVPVSTGSGNTTITATLISNAFQAKSAGIHPRLFANAEKFESMKLLVTNDPQFKSWYNEYKLTADRMLADADLYYVTVDQHGPENFLNKVSRPFAKHMLAWSFFYKMTGDVKYLDRIRRDLNIVLAFPDMHDQSLDFGEMSFGYGIAYDWLFEVLTPTERTAIVNMIHDHAFNNVNNAITNNSGFAKANGNVADVVAGGVSMAALAIMDESTQSAQIIVDLIKVYKERLIDGYQPEGVGTEGPMYWRYALKYGIRFLACMNSVLGTDFELSENDGLRGTGTYALYSNGPSGRSFNYSDSGSDMNKPMELLWLASRYNMPAYGWLALYNIGGEEDAIEDPFRFFWAQPENYNPPTEATFPLLRKFNGPVQLVSFRTAWADRNALGFTIKGGENMLNHGNLDLGDFALDANGVQWAINLGLEDYDSPGYFDFGGQRWTYYRTRAEGSNTLVINPSMDADQVRSTCLFESISSESGNQSTVLNLTNAYPASKSVKREVKFEAKAISMQDEIETFAPADIYWFMHTKAEITLENGGKNAVLTQDGKKLYAECTSPENGIFTIMNAVPLPGTPNPTQNNKNNGIRKLVISQSGITKTTIGVTFRTEKTLSTINETNTIDIRAAFNRLNNKIKVDNVIGNEYFTMLNSLGEMIYIGKDIESQNFSFLPNGLYLLNVSNQKSSKTFKLIK